ncbi:MAG TPA: hypothetical protein VNK92_06485 [Vicinamibacterales bacterium]|nr:hypothetical protein [Vicinamibacterales bacterium]
MPTSTALFVATLLAWPGPADALQAVAPDRPSWRPASQTEPARSSQRAPMTNEDVLRMLESGFTEAMVVAAIQANPTRFDVSPKALLDLKEAGVPEKVIEAMLAAEAAKKPAAASSPAPPPVPGVASQMATGLPPEARAMMNQLLGSLGRSEFPGPGGMGPGPQVWVVRGEEKVPAMPSFAQVAYTDMKGAGPGAGTMALGTLQGLASTALAFAGPGAMLAAPALGLAGGLGGMFGSGTPTTTMVWALPGAAAAHGLEPAATFEVEFAGIPGVDPDEFEPALVKLVPSRDNYRLVGAAKTKLGESGFPSDRIVEERMPARLERLDRGRYRVAPAALPPGEYALVIRPVAEAGKKKKKRKDGNALGDVMGGGEGQLLYLAWDFSVKP